MTASRRQSMPEGVTAVVPSEPALRSYSCPPAHPAVRRPGQSPLGTSDMEQDHFAATANLRQLVIIPARLRRPGAAPNSNGRI